MKVSPVFWFLALLMILFSGLLVAQPGLPGAPNQSPIDGGLGLLAAAGGVYALKKFRDKSKSDDQAKQKNRDID